jgi:hypothetical protein
LDSLEDTNRHYFISDINMWINEYKNNNKANETNVNNFYSHLSNISNLSVKSNDLHNEQFWNLLFSFIEIKNVEFLLDSLKIY